MKQEKAKTTAGKDVTLYYPESDADVDKLNEMLRAGKVGAPVLGDERATLRAPRRRD